MTRCSLYKDTVGSSERMDWKEEGEQKEAVEVSRLDGCSKAGLQAGQNSPKADLAGLSH